MVSTNLRVWEQTSPVLFIQSYPLPAQQQVFLSELQGTGVDVQVP